MPAHDDPRHNRLLASLTDADYQSLRPRLHCVELARGQVLHAPGLPQRHAWFPTSAVISKFCTLTSGGSSEVAVVGNEGVVGVSLLLGGETSVTCSEVLVSGLAFRIEASALQAEFGLSASARRSLLLYIMALMAPVAQTAICNRFHSVEQRVCGFLLHTCDRMDGDDVVVTQEGMAAMLGVRREGVTAAVGHLRNAAVVRLSRGHIDVIDLVALEQRACECHAVVKREYDRLLPPRPVVRSDRDAVR